MASAIRIGIVGAGDNTRVRHIPGLREQEGVEIVSVCNRSQESSQKVARDFGIPTVHDNWRELITSDAIDAVVIGTWPYLHCPITLAALDAGKHVMTEARMAMDAGQARLMLEKSRANPHLITQIVPSPITLRVDRMIRHLVTDGYLGEVLALDITNNANDFVDRSSPLHWRHDRNLSGLNILAMGIWYEALMRWVGEAAQVMAMTQVNVKQRSNRQGDLTTVTIPDHVDILARMACGAQARWQFSAVTGLASSISRAWLFGSKGSLCYDLATDQLAGGKRGDSDLEPIVIPAELEGTWRVEEEFINAIRGKEKISHTTFEDGFKYMQFTEAVTRSARSGVAVSVQEMGWS